MGPEEVYPAGPGVTGVQGDITNVSEVLGQVTALPSDHEDGSCACSEARLDGYDDILFPRLAQGSGLPTLQRPARRGRMRYHNRNLHPVRQLRDPHQRLIGTKPPGAAIERKVKGQDRDAVPLGEASQLVLLVGIPSSSIIIRPHRTRPRRSRRIHVRGQTCRRPCAEAQGCLNARRAISRNLSSVHGEWFW